MQAINPSLVMDDTTSTLGVDIHEEVSQNMGQEVSFVLHQSSAGTEHPNASLTSFPISQKIEDDDMLEKLKDEFKAASVDCVDSVKETALFQKAARIGHQLHRSGKPCEAIQYFQRALYLKNKTIIQESSDTQKVFADVLFDIGAIHSRTDKPKAIQAFQLCLDICTVIYGSDHPAVANVAYHLASVYASVGDMESAELLLQEALSILLFDCPSEDHLRHVWSALSKVQRVLGDDNAATSSISEVNKL